MNRHLKIAFFMAPVLALLSYALTGYLMNPEVSRQQQGQLLVHGQCLPTENACLLTLGPFELKLLSAEKQQQQQLALISNEPISHLTVALGSEDRFRQFPLMKRDDGKYWQLHLTAGDQLSDYQQLRLAFKQGDQPMYAETAVRF